MTATAPLTVVFDLDGTLVETAPDLLDALGVTLEAEGLPPLAFEEGRGLIGAGARALVERGLKAAGRTPDQPRVDELHAMMLTHYEAHIADKSVPYAHCIETLKTLKADGARLAVCTNKIERYARLLLDTLDMTSLFDAIVGGDTYPTSKPNPEMLLGAIERAGGDPSNAVMVGDSSTDVDAAKAAGVPVVVFTFGYTVTPARELGGDIAIDSYLELQNAVARLKAQATAA